MAILDDVCAKMHAQSDGADAKFVQVTLINKKESRQQQQQQQQQQKKKKKKKKGIWCLRTKSTLYRIAKCIHY